MLFIYIPHQYTILVDMHWETTLWPFSTRWLNNLKKGELWCHWGEHILSRQQNYVTFLCDFLLLTYYSSLPFSRWTQESLPIIDFLVFGRDYDLIYIPLLTNLQIQENMIRYNELYYTRFISFWVTIQSSWDSGLAMSSGISSKKVGIWICLIRELTVSSLNLHLQIMFLNARLKSLLNNP
jgi:hypothetical protein